MQSFLQIKKLKPCIRLHVSLTHIYKLHVIKTYANVYSTYQIIFYIIYNKLIHSLLNHNYCITHPHSIPRDYSQNGGE